MIRIVAGQPPDMAIEIDSRVYKYRIRFEYEKHGDASRGKTHTLTRFSVARGPGRALQ